MYTIKNRKKVNFWKIYMILQAFLTLSTFNIIIMYCHIRFNNVYSISFRNHVYCFCYYFTARVSEVMIDIILYIYIYIS